MLKHISRMRSKAAGKGFNFWLDDLYLIAVAREDHDLLPRHVGRDKRRMGCQQNFLISSDPVNSIRR